MATRTQKKRRHITSKLLFHATKHFEVRKWVRSQTANKEIVTFNKLLQYAKEHEATVRDFKCHKSNGGVAMATTTDEIRTFKFWKGNGQRAKGGPRKTCSKCGTSHLPRECPAWARNVTSMEIKIISVHVVGPNRQEMGTGDPRADPKDAKARVNHLIKGLEANL